jgi:hypothetical protein
LAEMHYLLQGITSSYRADAPGRNLSRADDIQALEKRAERVAEILWEFPVGYATFQSYAMKLSERISMGEDTAELREAIAVLAGWTFSPSKHAWQHPDHGWNIHQPDYLTDIRLTLADIERRGGDVDCGTDPSGASYCIITKGSDLELRVLADVDRKDRDLARCACEALVKALQNDK